MTPKKPRLDKTPPLSKKLPADMCAVMNIRNPRSRGNIPYVYGTASKRVMVHSKEFSLKKLVDVLRNNIDDKGNFNFLDAATALVDDQRYASGVANSLKKFVSNINGL